MCVHLLHECHFIRQIWFGSQWGLRSDQVRLENVRQLGEWWLEQEGKYGGDFKLHVACLVNVVQMDQDCVMKVYQSISLCVLEFNLTKRLLEERLVLHSSAKVIRESSNFSPSITIQWLLIQPLKIRGELVWFRAMVSMIA